MKHYVLDANAALRYLMGLRMTQVKEYGLWFTTESEARLAYRCLSSISEKYSKFS